MDESSVLRGSDLTPCCLSAGQLLVHTPHQIGVCVLGKLLELGVGDKHEADVISVCAHTTRTTFSEEENLREISLKTCGFRESYLASFKGPPTHYPWLSKIEYTLQPTPLGWGWVPV